MPQLNWTCNDCRIPLKRMKNDPLLLFDRKVDWERFRPILKRIWRKEQSHHPAGRPPYDVVLRFKIIILGVRNHCSDAALEEYRRDRLSWRRFLHWDGSEPTPDEKTIWKYRMVLAESGEMEALFDGDTAQMEAAGYHPQDGQRIDSSWVPAPKQRNTRAENAARKEGRVPPAWELQPHHLRQQDRDATWSCQHQKWPYGYKNHINVDRQYKIIILTSALVVTLLSRNSNNGNNNSTNFANLGKWHSTLGFFSIVLLSLKLHDFGLLQVRNSRPPPAAGSGCDVELPAPEMAVRLQEPHQRRPAVQDHHAVCGDHRVHP